MNAPSTWLRSLVVAVFLLVAAASPARAATETAPAPARAAVEVEPNDGLDDTARQPALVDGGRTTGILSAADDYDTFRMVVGAGRPGRVELTVTNTSPAAMGAVLSASITDRAGEQDLATTADDGLAPGQSTVLAATLGAGGAYRFAVSFLCDSTDPVDCPTSQPGATWSLAVKVRTGTLLLDDDGALGAAADAAAEGALDAAMPDSGEETDDGDTTTASPRRSALPKPGDAIPAACSTQGRAVKGASRKVATARRTHRKRHTKVTKRKLRVARAALTRANADLTDCKAIVASAAQAAEAELAGDESDE